MGGEVFFSLFGFFFFTQLKLLEVAAQMLQEEKEQKIKEREAALAERLPPLNLSGLSLQELMVFHFIRLFFFHSSQ